VLHVTNENGQKIVSPEKQRELRAAAVLIKHFTHLLPYSPNPESAMLHFREFLHQLFERPNWVDEFARIERPEVLNALAKLLGVSDFLWDDFLRMQYSNLFPIVRDVTTLENAYNRQELEKEAQKAVSNAANWREGLNAFKDREMFRIDMRHILGYTTEFGTFSEELTDLVEVVLGIAFGHCHKELVKLYGHPKLENHQPSEAVLLALGKCGGRELGFASDIELMLVYSGQGKTAGLKHIAVSNFYEELIQSLIQAIKARQEGVFHIDLQLRPYGKAGSQAVSLESFAKYYAPDGPAWPYERQALVKLRPIAGNDKLGNQLCKLRDEYVYNSTLFDVTAMRAMREKQVRHLVAAGTFNAKFSPGALVDIEYLVQGLQINYGVKDKTLRLTNIREAMAALHQAGLLSTEDYDRLRKAHTFMRWLIDSLRVVRGNAKDVNIPPYDSDEFAYLTRRLQYGSDVERLVQDLTRYPQDVLEINNRLLPA
jgi:glutamate-ammonia-ligase adenylyltransferase